MVNFPLKRKQNKKRPNFNYRKGVPKKKYHKFTSIENGGGNFRFQKCFLLRIKKNKKMSTSIFFLLSMTKFSARLIINLVNLLVSNFSISSACFIQIDTRTWHTINQYHFKNLKKIIFERKILDFWRHFFFFIKPMFPPITHGFPKTIPANLSNRLVRYS